MKMPGRCPICNDVMTNEFEIIWDVLHQKCNKRLSHNIEFIAWHKPSDNDLVQHIKIIDSVKEINWEVRKKDLTVHLLRNPIHVTATLPYFEPKFSDINKLMEKINMYLVFS